MLSLSFGLFGESYILGISIPLTSPLVVFLKNFFAPELCDFFDEDVASVIMAPRCNVFLCGIIQIRSGGFLFHLMADFFP